MILTENFTFEELIASSTAMQRGIDNMPGTEASITLRQLAERILQPLRNRWQYPIRVTSGYRCPKLNNAIGGSKSSQHLKGEAADITAIPHDTIGALHYNKIELPSIRELNRRLFNLACAMIREGEISVGQLIDEKNFSWIHISLPCKGHLNQILHL